jgi:Kef-type K+ transport system membrane component KefB
VVILIAGGILIGPQVLGWADPDSIELVSNLGLGFLFLGAGYELELGLFRERAGRLALRSWLVTAVVAVGVTGALAAAGFVQAFVPIAIGLTTTALGTLLPILRDNRSWTAGSGGSSWPPGRSASSCRSWPPRSSSARKAPSLG